MLRRVRNRVIRPLVCILDYVLPDGLLKSGHDASDLVAPLLDDPPYLFHHVRADRRCPDPGAVAAVNEVRALLFHERGKTGNLKNLCGQAVREI